MPETDIAEAIGIFIHERSKNLSRKSWKAARIKAAEITAADGTQQRKPATVLSKTKVQNYRESGMMQMTQTESGRLDCKEG